MSEALARSAMGLDLDLTLIDIGRRPPSRSPDERPTRCAHRHRRHGRPTRIADPGELGRWVAGDRVEAAVRCFRTSFTKVGVAHLRPAPGAAYLLAVPRRADVAAVVITSRRPDIVRTCLDACGLVVSSVAGSLAGVAKAHLPCAR